MHSTVQEAVEMALKMNATKACLTHFSQRYAVSESMMKKRKPMDVNHEEHYVKDYMALHGVMAADLLKFKLSELDKLPILSPGFNFGVSDDN